MRVQVVRRGAHSVIGSCLLADFSSVGGGQGAAKGVEGVSVHWWVRLWFVCHFQRLKKRYRRKWSCA